MYRKNTASQTIGFGKITATDGSDKSGVPTLVIRSIDGAAFTTATGTIIADVAGASVFQMSQADCNGQHVLFKAALSGMISSFKDILTDSNPPDVNLKNAAGTAVTLDANNVLNVSAKYVAGTVQTAIDLGTAIPNLSSAQLSGFTTVQVNTNLISANLGGLTSAQLSGFATVQTNTNLISSNLGGLTSAQLSGFSTVQTNTNAISSSLSGLTSAQLNGFATATTTSAAIKTQTDKLNFHGSYVQSSVKELNDHTLNGDGSGTPWGP